MAVRLSQGWRSALRALLRIQLQTLGIDGRLAKLPRRHRKPMREWLRQQHKESAALDKPWNSFFLGGPNVSDDFLPERAAEI